jgi:hypothetical protein
MRSDSTLEQSARAYAKIIDGVAALPRAELQPAAALPTGADQ